MSILRSDDRLAVAEEAVRYAREQLAMRQKSLTFAERHLAEAEAELTKQRNLSAPNVIEFPKLADGRCCFKSVVCPCGGWSCDVHGQRCRLDQNGIAHHD